MERRKPPFSGEMRRGGWLFYPVLGGMGMILNVLRRICLRPCCPFSEPGTQEKYEIIQNGGIPMKKERKNRNRIGLPVLLLTLVLAVSLSACGREMPQTVDTPAQKTVSAFQTLAREGGSPKEIADELAQLDWLPFEGTSESVEEGYLNGFTEEITGFSQGAVFGPMIGAIPYIGYVFSLEDGQDAEAFLQRLEGCADLRWNVCTIAEKTAKGAVGQTVCFVMSPLEFEE